MRSSKFLVLVISGQIICAVTTGAMAGECEKIAAVGDGLTKDIAVIMSTNGLKNIIEGKGMKGKGPVTTTCKDGTFMPQCQSSQTACK